MSFQWLAMRMTEETERRQREAQTLERLPRALEEVHEGLVACVKSYTESFGTEAAEIQMLEQRIRVTAREQKNGKWEPRTTVDVHIIPALPGFRIERDGEPLEILVGMLPGNKLFYRDAEKYLTMEELTRRILDKALFPKLGE
jgi:hypothetical protein